MLLWVSILSASCIFDGERCFISIDEQHEIMFTVSLEGHRTRASWGEEYPKEGGVPFDYRINPDELDVVVLDDDGTRLGQVSDIYYWPINQEHTEFQFVGEMPMEFVEHVNTHGSENPIYRFMVLANSVDNAGVDEYTTFSQKQLDPTADEAAIPMWGVKEADVSQLLSDNNLDLGTISLLRAAAKVEVKLSNELKQKGTTEIKSATLKYYNQTGYLFPAGWSQVDNTTDIDQEECIRVYRHAAVNMPMILDEESGDYYLYITEYDNINYTGERNKISLEISVAGEVKYFEDAISFCEYSDGAPVENSHYNIVRNHIYEFEIRSVAGSNLVLEYYVADWSTEDWDGNGSEYKEHELSYPTYHNPVVPSDYLNLSAIDQSNYIITKAPTMYYNYGDPELGGFHCYFQILAPDIVEWKPIITGSKENYCVRVYHVNSSLEENPTVLFDTSDDSDATEEFLGVCGAGEWFHIVIFPLSEDGADRTDIEFGITYYQNWTDQHINLYVNGEYNNIRWPDSGNNPKLINIKHISAN